jgi:putative membrane protein
MNQKHFSTKIVASTVSAFLLLALLLSPLAKAETTGSGTELKSSKTVATLSNKDRGYLEQLTQANRAEIAAAETALAKASDDRVKEFAQHMVTDHNKALADATELAALKNVELPSLPNAKQQKQLARLQSLNTVEFNKEYVNKSGIDDHREALKLVKTISKKAKDPELVALADKLQPIIASHLKMALDLNKN